MLKLVLLKLKWLWVACKENNALFSHGAECLKAAALFCDDVKFMSQDLHVLWLLSLYTCVWLYIMHVTLVNHTTTLGLGSKLFFSLVKFLPH